MGYRPHMDPTQRFSSRAEHYARYRPGYPLAAAKLLQERASLNDSSTIADIGSGTGLWTKVLLQLGCTVIGIEPNEPMRKAAERQLGTYPNFKSQDGTAEATHLHDRSVDVITAAQAFHWFKTDVAKREFARILKPDGTVALLWNIRSVDASPFLQAYEQLLLEFGTDYLKVRHEGGPGRVAKFFSSAPFEEFSFPYFQDLHWEGLRGRLLSSSYVPAEGHPRYPAMMERLKEIFDAHEEDGHVRIVYETQLFLGRVTLA